MKCGDSTSTSVGVPAVSLVPSSASSMLRTTIKKVVNAIAAKDKAAAEAAYKSAEPVMDRYASRGLIHKNKASRHKSRLSAHIKALA